MNWNKIVALLLILILTIQVLPLQQVGFVLFSNQINEELPHSVSLEKSSDLKFEPAKNDFADASLLIFSIGFDKNHIHYADSLPLNHESDIPTPPPNFS